MNLKETEPVIDWVRFAVLIVHSNHPPKGAQSLLTEVITGHCPTAIFALPLRVVIVDFLGLIHNRGEPQISRKKTGFLGFRQPSRRPFFQGSEKPSFDLLQPLLDNDSGRPDFSRLKLPLIAVARCLNLSQKHFSKPRGTIARRRSSRLCSIRRRACHD